MLLGIFRAYKFAISPMLLPACRYVPTCSDYAAEAVEKYGALRGTLMAAWRLLRCHPFAKGGFDPVPNLAQDMRCKAHDARHVAACNH
ncbi:MAG TPA: membrane protein insertion efficiency factor YidD [Terriglobales bacterium]|nr:membrane protein insertion efficiency factor YidD [Terriglobales bacterium]